MVTVESVLGEIRLIAGKRIPSGWLACQGQAISKSTYEYLYTAIGGRYGETESTFYLPDLRGRLPVGMGTGTGLTKRTIGEYGGHQFASIPTKCMPQHNHAFNVINIDGTTNYINRNTKDGGSVLANMEAIAGGVPAAYTSRTAAEGGQSQALSPSSVGSVGENLPHNNIMLTMAMTYIISYVKNP